MPGRRGSGAPAGGAGANAGPGPGPRAAAGAGLWTTQHPGRRHHGPGGRVAAVPGQPVPDRGVGIDLGGGADPAVDLRGGRGNRLVGRHRRRHGVRWDIRRHPHRAGSGHRRGTLDLYDRGPGYR